MSADLSCSRIRWVRNSIFLDSVDSSLRVVHATHPQDLSSMAVLQPQKVIHDLSSLPARATPYDFISGPPAGRKPFAEVIWQLVTGNPEVTGMGKSSQPIGQDYADGWYSSPHSNAGKGSARCALLPTGARPRSGCQAARASRRPSQ